MDPHSPNLDSLDLPKPAPEQMPANLGESQDSANMAEQQKAQQLEQGSSIPDPAITHPTSGPIATNPLTRDLPASTRRSSAPPIAATGSMLADDTDLIEKEWVIRAKAIVDQTRNDPYQQNKAINKVKADYLKQRYQKDIKLTDE